jgi:hypothetical protein
VYHPEVAANRQPIIAPHLQSRVRENSLNAACLDAYLDAILGDAVDTPGQERENACHAPGSSVQTPPNATYCDRARGRAGRVRLRSIFRASTSLELCPRKGYDERDQPLVADIVLSTNFLGTSWRR